MFAKVMFIDDLSNPDDELVSINPDFVKEAVHDAIAALNGSTVRMVGFGQEVPTDDSGYPFGGLGMLVGGGGPNRMYVCQLFKEFEDKTAFLLSRDSSSVQTVEVMFGQPTTYEERFCNTMDDVLDAATQFCIEGKIDFFRWSFAGGSPHSLPRQREAIRSWFDEDRTNGRRAR